MNSIFVSTSDYVYLSRQDVDIPQMSNFVIYEQSYVTLGPEILCNRLLVKGLVAPLSMVISILVCFKFCAR